MKRMKTLTIARPKHNHKTENSMSSNNYDAVIIGGGHNGLVCAYYLAKAGLNIRVVDAYQLELLFQIITPA